MEVRRNEGREADEIRREVEEVMGNKGREVGEMKGEEVVEVRVGK